MEHTQYVIGFKGEKECGKSTCSKYLRQWAGSGDNGDFEYSDILIEVANFALTLGDSRPYQFGDALLEGARVIFDREIPNVDYAMRFREGKGAQVEFALRDWLDTSYQPGLLLDRGNKAKHRAVTTWVSANLGEMVGYHILAEEMDKRIMAAPEVPLITVGGVRVPVEADLIKLRNGYIVAVRSNRSPDDDDPANSQRHAVIPDATVHNDGPFETVGPMMARLYQDLLSGSLKPDYYPS